LNALKTKGNQVCPKRIEWVLETCRAGQILPFSRRDLSGNPADNAAIFWISRANNKPAAKTFGIKS